MTDLRVNESTEVFKTFLKQVGLDHESITIVETATIPFEPYLAVALMFKIPINIDSVRTNKPFMGYFQEIMDRVANSPSASARAESSEAKLKMANSEIDFLRNEIVKLSKFETHYNLEMALRHGEKK